MLRQRLRPVKHVCGNLVGPTHPAPDLTFVAAEDRGEAAL